MAQTWASRPRNGATPSPRSEARGLPPLLDLIRRAWAGYWMRRAARATVGVLQALDDRALKDIGLYRGEIESVVYGERRYPELQERRVRMH